MLAQLRFAVRNEIRCTWYLSCTPQRLDAKVVAARMVKHDHVEGRRGGAFLDIPPHVEPFRIGPPMNDFVDRARVAVKSENHVSGCTEHFDEGGLVHAMRMKPRMP